MFQIYWKFIWWFFCISVMLWFLIISALPIYGWLSPWPEAEQKLDAEGVKGLKLMVGSGGSSERESATWSEERQRSYVVLPDSLRSMEIFTYVESSGSRITGVEREVLRIRWAAILLFLLWVLAGWFSIRTVKLWAGKLKSSNA
jgi:hypothetical protein